jgi:hypothetical protein
MRFVVLGLCAVFAVGCSSTVTVTVTPGDGYLDVSWEGGDQATVGFDVQALAAPGTPKATGGFGLSAEARTIRLTGLTNGTRYNVSVFQYDSGPQLVGTGTASGTPVAGTDAGPVDSGIDAGPLDAGTTDSGAPDSGAPDAGTLDAGTDAGSTDAGTDAGTTSPWVVTTLDAQGRDLTGLWGSGANDVYAVGIQGAAYHYDGAHWASVNIGAGTTNFFSVWGASATQVYVATGSGNQGAIYGLAGSSWASLATAGQALFSVWGSSAQDVYAVGASGTILHSTDGTTFAVADSGTDTNLLAIWGRSATDVYAVGGQGGVPGLMLHSNDHGTSWEVIDAGVPVSHSLVAIWGNASTLYVSDLQSNGVISSTDGQHWGPGPTSPANAAGVYGIWGSSATDVYFGGATTTQGFIARSTGSSAMTLETVPGSAACPAFEALWGSSATDVFAVGAGGLVAHKTGP